MALTTPKHEDLPAAPRVPDPDRLVDAGRGEPTAVGVEGHAVDRVAVGLERADLPAGRRGPDPDRPVGPPRGEPGAVGAEGHGGDGNLMRLLADEDDLAGR